MALQRTASLTGIPQSFGPIEPIAYVVSQLPGVYACLFLTDRPLEGPIMSISPRRAALAAALAATAALTVASAPAQAAEPLPACSTSNPAIPTHDVNVDVPVGGSITVDLLADDTNRATWVTALNLRALPGGMTIYQRTNESRAAGSRHVTVSVAADYAGTDAYRTRFGVPLGLDVPSAKCVHPDGTTAPWFGLANLTVTVTRPTRVPATPPPIADAYAYWGVQGGGVLLVPRSGRKVVPLGMLGSPSAGWHSTSRLIVESGSTKRGVKVRVANSGKALVIRTRGAKKGVRQEVRYALRDAHGRTMPGRLVLCVGRGPCVLNR